MRRYWDAMCDDDDDDDAIERQRDVIILWWWLLFGVIAIFAVFCGFFFCFFSKFALGLEKEKSCRKKLVCRVRRNC